MEEKKEKGALGRGEGRGWEGGRAGLGRGEGGWEGGRAGLGRGEGGAGKGGGRGCLFALQAITGPLFLLFFFKKKGCTLGNKNVGERSVGVGGGLGLSRPRDVGGRHIAGILRLLGKRCR